MHLGNVSVQDLSQILGMHVHSEDVKDLSEQFLLMQIVKLEGGVHSVDHGVLVDKSGELSHDGLDERSRVGEVVHHMAARNDFVSSVHAVVESGDTVDVVDSVGHNSLGDNLMGDSVRGGELLGSNGSGSSSIFFVILSISGLNESKGRQ